VAGRRNYNQDCPIANGLDVLGERWTLLIVRELVGGPSRYSDLRAQLPGIATNLLAQRLDELEQAGVVERTELPPPIARTVYTPSDIGWRLVLPILGAVARFGLQTMRFSTEESRSPLNRFLIGVLLGFESANAVGVEATYRVQVDGRNFDFAVTAGRLAGARHEPDVTLSASASDLVTARLGNDATQRVAALRRLRFYGSDDEVETMGTVLGLTNESAAASTSPIIEVAPQHC
jgi:DNA-binding HxlR family transcriptional regulator